ncbi:hypothetical protein ACFOY2_37270 [Nonomuraea purpurea]|uniref:DeoxyPurine in DNA protein A domain-containing protein n=1 Tax=Nonomuraea purpurea TaxID=1849276 RepID=A0ABV8GL62_9ACTN
MFDDPWALDSGGFTKLALHGQWVTTPEEYTDLRWCLVDEIWDADVVGAKAPASWPESLLKHCLRGRSGGAQG